MMKYKTLAACLVLLLAATAFAVQSSRDNTRPASALTRDFQTYIDANKILMFVTNKGSFAYDNGVLLGKADGLYYPYTGIGNIESGSNTTTAIYAASVWTGATIAATADATASVGDTLVTSGQHDTDWGEGPLVYDPAVGWSMPVPNAISDLRYRVYKLYSDSLADNPNQDYLEWPADQGAPVDDNGDPLLPAGNPAQVCWSVYNDLDVTAHVGARGTVGRGLGLEVKQTMWAYESEGALANMVFARFRIYNKGPHDLTNMYVSLWADPDLGDANDDFVGCDTSLSLGYCYNADADDTDYGSTPPAPGFDFFQGPLIYTGNDADTAIMWDFEKFPGYTNMGMVSFNRYVNPLGPDTPTDSYRFMNGLTKDGSPLLDNNGDTTLYFGYGDPVAATGFLDTDPADRRWMQSTGPFDFNRGDSTEIVAAIIVAQGTDYLNSITELKAVDEFAQGAYDREFQLPQAPAPPDVTVTNMDGRVILTWGTASEDNPGAYPFEGYAVMQGDAANDVWTDTLGWYDITNGMGNVIDVRFDPLLGEDVRFVKKPGTDAGLEHMFMATRDHVGGGPLINYTEYDFKVEAYSVDTTGPKGERTLTSARKVIVMPEPTPLGTEYNTVIGDTLIVTHTAVGGAELSPGSATVRAVNPTEVTGDDYKIAFTSFYVEIIVDDEVDPPDTTWDTITGTVWHVINTTTGDTVVNNWVNQSGELGNDYPVVDGLLCEVSGPPIAVSSFQCVANGDGVIDPPEAAAAPAAFNGANFPTPTDVDPDGYPTDGQQVGEGTWLFHTGGDYQDYDEWIERTFRLDANRLATLGGYDWEMRFTGENSNPGVNGCYAWAAFTTGAAIWVPFELWRIGVGTPDDPSDDVKLIPWIFDDGGDSLYYMSSWGADPNCGPGGCDHPVSGGANDPYTDWIYWKVPGDQTPGDAGYQVFETAMLSDPYSWEGNYEIAVMDRTVLVNWNGDTTATATGGATVPSGYNQDLPELGTVFRLITEKPNQPTDEFHFSSANLEPVVAATGDESMLADIKAVPNPYYLFSSYDASVVNRVHKFINLPGKCTISIYNLGGDMVRRLEKDDDATQLEWNLLNHVGIPLASGIYIYVVEAPDFGQKIGKMAIFTETEQLNQF